MKRINEKILYILFWIIFIILTLTALSFIK